jgi:hypothetical protein
VIMIIICKYRPVSKSLVSIAIEKHSQQLPSLRNSHMILIIIIIAIEKHSHRGIRGVEQPSGVFLSTSEYLIEITVTPI